MYSGDLLVVDRSVEAKHGDIVIAAVNGEPLCKRMCHEHGVLVLRSENPKYPSRYIMEGDTFEVWGCCPVQRPGSRPCGRVGVGFGRTPEESGHAV